MSLAKALEASVRTLTKHKAFSAVVILTLALGIGANAAIFSLVDAVLLTPLPYDRPDAIARVWSTHQEKGLERMGVSSGDIVDWRRRSEGLEAIGGWYVMGRTLQADDVVEVVNVAQVSEDFFSVLATPPVLGRTFTPEETARATFNTAASPTGTDPVVVLSYGAWQQRFGADPEILERSIVLDRLRFRVVGVMPRGFDMPRGRVELWIPWSFEGRRPHDQRYLGAIARVRPGASMTEAEENLNAVASVMGDELPESNEGWGVTLIPLRDDLVGNVRATVVVVFGAVAAVLLIACLNIACLYLVRIGERQKEIVLRLALGASRGRLARQFLSENLLVAVVGGALSIPTAFAAMNLIGAILPQGLLPPDGLVLNLRVAGYAGLLTTVVGLFFGLVPVIAGPRVGLAASMKDARVRAPGWESVRKWLVTIEVGMAVVLLAAGGLLVRSFGELMEVDVGFRPERVVVLPITLDNHEYNSGAKTRAYYRRLTESLAALPGVDSVGGVTALPMSPIGPDFDRPVWAEGDEPSSGGYRRADIRMATPGYFETIGISVLRGRGFDRTDTPESPKVILVNESLAAQIWPGENPVGKRLVIDYASAGTHPYEVIGLAGDVRFRGIREEPRPELYIPHQQRSYLIMNIAVRTEVAPDTLVPELRQAVLDVDPLQPAYSVLPLSQLVSASVERDRFAMLLIGSFGVVALGLALLGIFGVVSYHVAQRTHEVGIRAALGASRRELVTMILSSGLKLTFSGVALGLVLSFATTRLMAALLFGVSPLDPVTFIAVSVLPAIGAVVACLLPARRAAGVDPVVALRHE